MLSHEEMAAIESRANEPEQPPYWVYILRDKEHIRALLAHIREQEARIAELEIEMDDIAMNAELDIIGELFSGGGES